MTTETIEVHPHTVSGSERLNEAMVRAYLAAGGYQGETEAMMAEAREFPGTYVYTADRHRYIAWKSGGWWLAGDCTEERIIKTL